MIIKPGKFYTIESEVFPLYAVQLKDQIVPKNLKASYSWLSPTTRGAYFEGYAIQGQQLVPIQNMVSNGRPVIREEYVEIREPVDLSLLRECEFEVIEVDMAE